MQKDHPQFSEAYSPRNIVGLTHELDSVQVPENGHFEFGDEENPFSYYHEENKREEESSEDDSEPNGRVSNDIKEGNKEHKEALDGQVRDVGQNVSDKPPVKIMKSPNARVTSPKAAFTTASVLSSLKDPQVDLAKFSFNSSGKKKLQQQNESDAKYKTELEDQLSDLKANLKNGKKKSKIFGLGGKGDGLGGKGEKVAVNKTDMAIGRGRREQMGDMEVEEMRMLVKMGFEKKKANYRMLKEWDKRRAQSMALHGKIIEQLQNETDNFELYQTFFREKAKQEQKYVGSPVVNTRFALQHNSLSKNVYINCSVILNALHDDNLSRCTRITHFIQLIRHNILHDLTEQHLDASQKELLRVREKISSLKTTLKKYNHETEEKANQMANLFTEQAASISYKVQKDFYRTQLSFLRTAYRQLEIQKKLGEYCLEYYHTAIQQQIKRSKVIHHAMVTYSQGLKQAYHLELPPSELQQMTKHEEIKLISELYSLEEMFDERTMEMFRILQGIEADMTIEGLTKYINRFAYEPFDSRVILLKQFNVQLVIANKGKQTNLQPSYLVITVDNFLHLFFSRANAQHAKPDLTIKIHSKWLEIRPGKDEHLDIIKKQERRNSMMAYFWDSRPEKVYRIKFSKKDNREEFMDYITKLMLDFN